MFQESEQGVKWGLDSGLNLDVVCVAGLGQSWAGGGSPGLQPSHLCSPCLSRPSKERRADPSCLLQHLGVVGGRCHQPPCLDLDEPSMSSEEQAQPLARDAAAWGGPYQA